MNGNESKELGRIGLLCHGSNLHRFGIGSNGLGSTLKNAKFKGDNILISTQVHSTQFDLSQFDLSYSTKRVDLILFDLFHSTHFIQSKIFKPNDSTKKLSQMVLSQVTGNQHRDRYNSLIVVINLLNSFR